MRPDPAQHAGCIQPVHLQMCNSRSARQGAVLCWLRTLPSGNRWSQSPLRTRSAAVRTTAWFTPAPLSTGRDLPLLKNCLQAWVPACARVKTGFTLHALQGVLLLKGCLRTTLQHDCAPQHLIEVAGPAVAKAPPRPQMPRFTCRQQSERHSMAPSLMLQQV